MFLYLVGIVTMLWVVVDHLKRRKILALAKTIPSLKLLALPFIGHGHHFIGTDEGRMKTFQIIGKDTLEKGGMVFAWLGRRLFLIVSDPETGAFILKSSLKKGHLMTFCQDLTGNGSIFADVHIWRPRRKVLAPAFSPRILKQFTDIFSKRSRILVQRLQSVSGTGDFEIWNYLVAYAMDAVSETNLGVKVSAQTSTNDHEFIVYFNKAMKVLAQRLVQPWLHMEMVYKLSSHFTYMEISKKIMYGFIDGIIRDKRQELENPENKRFNVDESECFKTFLEMLIENSGGAEGFTDIELREEVLVIAMAGTDTSAVGAGFILLMLAKHPDVQEKVYKEICDVMGSIKNDLSHEDLCRLKYLEAVVKESLRLYPPVPVIVRDIDKEIILPTGQTLLPGVEVVINIWALHRNPKYWGEDAEIFRPERFIDTKLTHPAAFMPFSYGPRNCLGYQYAMMSMMIVVASLVRRYRILRSTKLTLPETMTFPFSKSPENERVKFDVMMKDVNNFTLRLENRIQTTT